MTLGKDTPGCGSEPRLISNTNKLMQKVGEFYYLNPSDVPTVAKFWLNFFIGEHRSSDPWELIFKNQCTTFPYHDSMRSMQTSKLKEFIVDLDKYSNGETVSSAGLRNGSQLMLEYALFTEKNIT